MEESTGAGLAKINISVIVCTYNGFSRGFLEAALDSVCAQTSRPFEIILIDDGSTDGTADFVLLRYPMVKVVSQKNCGLPAARNKGLEVAAGNWIAFLDDDDIWHAEKLEVQISEITECCFDENIIFASKIENFFQDRKQLRPVIPNFKLLTWPNCLVANPITAPSGVVISRLLLNRVGHFNGALSIGEDYEYWIRCIADGAKIRYSRVPLVKYRVHQNQMTSHLRLERNLAATDSVVEPFLAQLHHSEREVIILVRLIKAVLALSFKINPIVGFVFFIRRRSVLSLKVLFKALILVFQLYFRASYFAKSRSHKYHNCAAR